MSIPERTVDAWASIYLTSRFPSMRLWAPTVRGWDDWDFAGDPGLGPGKLFVLECKSTIPVGSEHVASLNWRQFARYLALPLTRSITHYVLPAPPWRGSPGIPPPLVPHEAAGWRGCADWLYVIAARDLRRYFGGISTTLELRSSSLPSIPGGKTLRGFVDGLLACTVGRRIDPKAARVGPGPEGTDEFEGDDRAWSADAGKPVMTPIVAFVPEADLPNFRRGAQP